MGVVLLGVESRIMRVQEIVCPVPYDSNYAKIDAIENWSHDLSFIKDAAAFIGTTRSQAPSIDLCVRRILTYSSLNQTNLLLWIDEYLKRVDSTWIILFHTCRLDRIRAL